MSSSDYLSLISLFITIVGIPIGYFLGCRSARNTKYNELIENLESINQKILELFLDVYYKKKSEITDYHLMVAYFKKIQRHTYELNYISGSDYILDFNLLLLDIKKILTNKLFSEISEVKKSSVGELVIKLDILNGLYTKKFY